jgi:hypothetical protein
MKEQSHNIMRILKDTVFEYADDTSIFFAQVECTSAFPTCIYVRQMTLKQFTTCKWLLLFFISFFISFSFLPYS